MEFFKHANKILIKNTFTVPRFLNFFPRLLFIKKHKVSEAGCVPVIRIKDETSGSAGIRVLFLVYVYMEAIKFIHVG
jgi:hypothetical protein